MTPRLGRPPTGQIPALIRLSGEERHQVDAAAAITDSSSPAAWAAAILALEVSADTSTPPLDVPARLGERRDQTLTVRLSPDLHRQLQLQAGEEALARYLRRVVVGVARLELAGWRR